MLKHVTIASGGVIPRIQPELLVRKKGGKVVLPIAPKPSPKPAAKTTTLIKTTNKKTKAAPAAKVADKGAKKGAKRGKAAVR